MDGLIEKQLVRKEIVRGLDGVETEKWGLLRGGEVLGECCDAFDRSMNHSIPVKDINSRSAGMNLALCLDTREDVHLLERIKQNCDDENVPHLSKDLPAGDYLFIDQSRGQENVLPLVIERKSWSDLADSCQGKGRASNRLDCVNLDGAECGGNCQICKMKRSGCSQIIFIIEGERCLGRDGNHRSVKKCTRESCCSACRLLKERHDGMTQDVLEGVLHRIQLEQGCLIHYTKSYNETIQSLFDIRTLLQTNSTCLLGRPQSYELYASKSRSRSIVGDSTLQPRPTTVRELNVEEMLTLVEDREWDRTLLRNLLGQGTSRLAQEQSSSSRRPRQPRSNQAADEVICLDLESTENGSKHSSSRPKKRRKANNNETICLDSDSDDEITPIRGVGGGSLSSDDDEIEVVDKLQEATIEIDDSDSDDSLSDLNKKKTAFNKRKSSIELSSQKSTESSQPLIILNKWDEYEQKINKKVDSVWKNIYSTAVDNNQRNEIYSNSITCLNDLKSSAFPVVRRRTLMRFTLWLQLVMKVQLRSVVRSCFSEDIKRRLGGGRSATTSTAATTQVSRNHTQHTALARTSFPSQHSMPHSTPIATRPPRPTTMSRKPPPPPMTKEREARLRKFEKTTNTTGAISSSVSAASASQRKRPPSSSWACPTCTLENSLESTSCSACGRASPMKAASTSSRAYSGIWACTHCTLDNEAHLNICSACDTPRDLSSQVLRGSSLDQDDDIWADYDRTRGINAPGNSHLQQTNNNSNYYRQPQSNTSGYAAADSVSSSYQASKPAAKKRVRCGACHNEGHNRATANPMNCPAYYDDKEVDRREKQKLKRENQIILEQQKIKAIERESDQADKMQHELQRQIEELQRNKDRAQEFRTEELRKRTQKLKRLQKKNRSG